jgi:transcriptional regulator with XRE-family HTH domain
VSIVVRSGGTVLNETLCHALLRAQLTEEDVAARLQVDPKTVRRWLEGRVPYLRYRWAIAAMLGADETDLWPQLRAARTRPDEVVAVYAHRDTMPQDIWLRVLGSAQHEIGILDDASLSPVGDQPIIAALSDRAHSGVSVRICLYNSDASDVPQCTIQPENSNPPTTNMSDMLAVYAPLHEKGQVQIRQHRGVMYTSIYYADEQLLVSQHAYGIPAGQSPVLHLRCAEGGEMVTTYLDAFEHAWSDARSAK